MPYTTSSDGARIHYEAHGAGEPVLMIMGLGSNAYGWKRSLPWISERHQAITFDNRGVGRSDVPEGAYGEVHVRSPYLMLGYWNDPAASVGRFAGGGWCLTGQLARIDADGDLWYPERQER